MAALQRVVPETAAVPVRFAVLVTAAVRNPKDGARLCLDLRMERAASELLGWVLAWSAETVVQTDAEGLMQLIEQVKGLHHPERLQRMARVWNAVAGDAGVAAGQRAGRALRAAAVVDSATIADEGWSGPELGRRLRQRRVQSIAAVL